MAADEDNDVPSMSDQQPKETMHAQEPEDVQTERTNPEDLPSLELIVPAAPLETGDDKAFHDAAAFVEGQGEDVKDSHEFLDCHHFHNTVLHFTNDDDPVDECHCFNASDNKKEVKGQAFHLSLDCNFT